MLLLLCSVGNTLAHAAVGLGSMELLQYLKARGADLSLRNKAGHTAKDQFGAMAMSTLIERLQE